MKSELMSTCWADRSPDVRCLHRVSTSSDHIGLCAYHLDALRDPDFVSESERADRIREAV